MIKRILSTIAAVLMLFTLVSCFSSCEELLGDVESIKALLEGLDSLEGVGGSTDETLTAEKDSFGDAYDDPWDDEYEDTDTESFPWTDGSETESFPWVDGSETESDIETTPVEVYPSTVEKKNYNDEFYLWILPDVNPMSYYWVEYNDGDVISEALYERQQQVYDYLGVEIIGSSAGNYRSYVEPFRTAVTNEDGSVDCLISHVQTGVSGFVKGNSIASYLMDFNDLDGVNLEEDYWNTEIMDDLAINGKRYLGFSDINIPYTYVIAFNKEMMDQYAGSMENSIYDLVDAKLWTLEKMISLAQLVYTDNTGDGKTPDDVYGLTGQQWVPWIGFFKSSDINLVEQNSNGKYEIAFMNEANSEKTNNLVKKLKDFSVSEFAYLTFPEYGSISANPVPLESGRALMELTSTFDLIEYQKYDVNFGVVPYPLYDKDQEDYKSLQWGGFLCVPAYLRNEMMAGETLEVMSYYSDGVREAFFEKMLGAQAFDSPEDARMLEEHVWKNLCTDFGQVYGDEANSVLYFLPYVTRPVEDGGKEMMSYYASFSKSSNKSIYQFVQIVSSLEDSD